MRVTVAEGTPDEIRQLFPHLAEAQVEAQAARPNGAALSADVQQVLGRTRPADWEAIHRFMTNVMEWGDVRVEAGHKQDGGLTPYVRFHRRNGNGAAFAYLFPRGRYVRPHLPAADFANARFGTTRGGNAARGEWSTNLALTPEDAWEEALSFTRRAYEAAGE